ncbi:MAG: HAMP domain-containing histidine kinase [Lachnospiraceae bacterium]|nr:HAMP domain-containing histidine kinase [Lachnospiraceae bacterium]
MFKKSRRKIIAVIMSIFIALFAGTLCIIYYCSYQEVYRQNREMLLRYAQAYWQNGNPAGTGELPPDSDMQDFQAEHAYRLLSFHSAAFSESGAIISIDNDPDMGLSDEALIALAGQLIAGESQSGVYGSWVYLIEGGREITLVVLMDNMILSGSMGTLLRYTVFFGGIVIFLLFFISLYLARRIVQPLEEGYQKQKQFISDAGHELKTPLAVISTNAEMLERKFGQNKWLDNIRYENSRMTELVRRLLELTRAENARPQMLRVNFSRIATGGILAFESTAYEKELQLVSEIRDEIYVSGDAGQLGNLVSILTDNALSYAPKHSVVTAALWSERGRAYFSVTNEGPEISKEQQKSLFERFYRADSARGGNSSHYGLGLAIAKAIVTSHQGKIEVSCQAGQITFTVSIPASS